MLQRLLLITLTLCSLTASAQWQQTGSKVRYVNGLGIPTKDTAAGVAADSSQILIRPADSSLYIKYKRTWQKVGGGGGGTVTGSGASGQVTFWTGVSSVSADGAFLWDNTNKRFTVTGSASVLQQLNGTTTNNAYLDFQNAGTSQIRIGNNYNGGTQLFQIIDQTSTTPILTYDRSLSRISFPASAIEVLAAGSLTNNGVFSLGINNVTDLGYIGDRTTLNTKYIKFNRASALTDAVNIQGVNGGVGPSALALNAEGGNVGVGYTAPAAKLSVNGTALINTNTDNGVDKLQVSGSAIAEILKATGTNNNLAILNGTGTTNSLVDFQNAGATKWRIGNNYNSGTQAFVLNNLTTAKNNFVVLPSNKYLFNSDNLTQADALSDYEFHKVGTTTGTQMYVYNWGTGGTRTPAMDWAYTRGASQGSYSATLNGDTYFAFGARGSTNSGFVQGGYFLFQQEGSVSTFAPTKMLFSVASSTAGDASTLTISGPSGYSAFNNKLLINTTSDNGVDELQVNGSISGIGFKQAYVTKTGAYTATNDDYVIDCTSGTFTVTLPASSGRTGRILIIKNSGAGTITVDGNASETIDGAATYSLSVQYATVQIMSDGTNWKIIAKF